MYHFMLVSHYINRTFLDQRWVGIPCKVWWIHLVTCNYLIRFSFFLSDKIFISKVEISMVCIFAVPQPRLSGNKSTIVHYSQDEVELVCMVDFNVSISLLAGINITYQWKKENSTYLDIVNMQLSNVSDLTDTYTVTDVNITDAGMYNCDVSFGGGGEHVKLPPKTSITSQLLVISKDYY